MSKIEVVDNREVHLDARRGVTNTGLAAALLTLNFQLNNQPFSTVASGKGGKNPPTKIWFKPAIKHPKTGGLIPVQSIERAWELPDSTDWPMVPWMRKACEARRWLIEVVRKENILSKVRISVNWWKTDELFAASTVAGINRLLVMGYRDRFFYLAAEAKPHLDAYSRPEGGTREQWSRAVLEQQRILVDKITGKENPRLINVRNDRSGHVLTYTTDAPDDLARTYLAALHHN